MLNKESRHYKLTDFFKDIQNGKSINELTFKNGNYPVYGSSEILFYSNKFQFKEDAIIIGRVGENCGCIQIGKSPFWASDNTIVCFIKNEYNIYYIKSLLEKIDLHKLQNGSGQPLLTATVLKNIEFSLENTFLQMNEIGNRIKNIEDLIVKNNNIINVLANKIKDIYSLYFHKFNNYKELVHSEKLNLNIPKNYQVKNIEDILCFEKGIEPGSSSYFFNKDNDKDYVKFYRVGDIDGNKTENVYLKKEISNKIDYNEVAITFDGTIGKTIFGIKGGFSSALQKVKFKSISNSSGLIYAILTDERIQKFLENGSRSGSILKHASTLKKYLFIPYNSEDYIKASNQIQPLFELAVNLKIINVKLDNLKQELLAWYLY